MLFNYSQLLLMLIKRSNFLFLMRFLNDLIWTICTALSFRNRNKSCDYECSNEAIKDNR